MTMTKLQLSLTDQEVALLEGFGSQFGYSLPKTVRFVISKASEQILQEGILPIYEMSKKTERKGLLAVEEYRAGRTTEVSVANDFFDSL